MIKLFVVIFLSGCFETKAMTFAQAIKALHSHESVDSVRLKSKALDKEAESRGSWGDPKFKIAAKNFPKDSLKDDQTPMSGIEMGVSQKIALTTKYGNLERSFF